MRTRRYNPKCLESIFLRDPDSSGVLIQGAVFTPSYKSNAYFIPALENHCTVKSIHIRNSRACNVVDDISFLRYISSFFVQKAGQRASPQFQRVALLISRKLHKNNLRALNNSCTLHNPVYYHSCSDSDSEIPTSPTNGTTQQTLLVSHHIPTNTAPERSSPRRECARTFSRRSTFCGPYNASVSKPGFGSPKHPCTFNPRLDPPLTPVNQILSTPKHPPRIETKEPRTSCDRVLLDREFDFTRLLSLANARSPEEISYHIYQTNHRLSFRNRLWVRRLSYPHFNNSPVSHPVCSSLKMSDITIAINANHQLASPLNVRSSTSTRCTPQTMEDGGPHLQWSPHCLRCFAWH